MTKPRNDRKWSRHPFPPLTHALLRAIAEERSKREPNRVYLARAMHDALAEYAKRHFPGLVGTVTAANPPDESPEEAPPA